jgi:hypothetical protein
MITSGETATIHELKHYMTSLPEPYKGQVLTMWDAFGELFEKESASKNHHSNFPGGLVVHTCMTIRAAKTLYKAFKKLEPQIEFTLDEAIFVLILHDFGKIRSSREKPYRDHVIHIQDMILECKIPVDEKIAQALIYHHGGYGPTCKNPNRLTVFVHTCDMWASNFLEVII